MRKIAILLAVILLLLSGCATQEKPDPRKYADYQCFDRYLACTKLYSLAGTKEVRDEHSDTIRTLAFRKPFGASDDQFVCVQWEDEDNLSVKHSNVWQNPDNYVDVFQEWTIQRIELFRSYDISFPKQRGHALHPSKIVADSKDPAVIGEFLDFVTHNQQSAQEMIPEGLHPEEFGENAFGNPTWAIIIRAYFNEGKNIVWESEVRSYSDGRYITITKEQERNTPNQTGDFSALINGYEHLYNWVAAGIDS